jgi:hypothetical protein
MPLYYFGLDEAPPSDQDGEELPDDDAARKFAKLIVGDLQRNKASRVEVVVFDAEGSPSLRLFASTRTFGRNGEKRT